MLFEEWNLPRLKAPNRLVRSATIEGMADASGRPTPALGKLYADLAAGGVGTIVTGFCYVSPDGRSMHPGQCGIDAEDKVAPWREVVRTAKEAAPGVLLVMQIAHAGRQTLRRVTGHRPAAPSRGRSPYFGERPRVMEERDVQAALEAFAAAALRAREAGFDGVQLHGAHGYLIHQFLSPATNRRKDAWGADRVLFLEEAVRRVRRACGGDFPVLLKISATERDPRGLTPEAAGRALARAEGAGAEAAEISCGTMDHAFDIFRGGIPIEPVLEHNPLFNRKPRLLLGLWRRFAFPSVERGFPPFREHYNLQALRRVRVKTRLPLILVGGVRRLASIEALLASGEAGAVALCRPLIREPDLPSKFRRGLSAASTCTNCNLCAVMVDSPEPLRCRALREGGGSPPPSAKERRTLP